MTDKTSAPKTPDTPFFANSLIAHFKTKFTTKTAACEKVAPLLGIHHKTVMIIANGGYCGKLTGRKIKALYNELVLEEEPSTPQLWIKVIFETQEDKDFGLSLDMKERVRRILG